MTLGRLGGVYALLHASDRVADMWVQTDNQAQHKGDNGWNGQLACARHVATLTATQALTLWAGSRLVRERPNTRRMLLGLAFSAVSHYAADRREHGILPKLTERLAFTGKDVFYRVGDGKAAPCGTAAFGLDQTFHDGCRIIAALIITGSDQR
jgi:hypothetical protein